MSEFIAYVLGACYERAYELYLSLLFVRGRRSLPRLIDRLLSCLDLFGDDGGDGDGTAEGGESYPDEGGNGLLATDDASDCSSSDTSVCRNARIL